MRSRFLPALHWLPPILAATPFLAAGLFYLLADKLAGMGALVAYACLCLAWRHNALLQVAAARYPSDVLRLATRLRAFQTRFWLAVASVASLAVTNYFFGDPALSVFLLPLLIRATIGVSGWYGRWYEILVRN